MAAKLRTQIEGLTKQEKALPAAQTRKLARTFEFEMEKLHLGKGKETSAEAET